MFPTLRRALSAAAIVAGTTLTAISCDSTASGTGRLDLYLTDAPGDIRQAVVTIDRIYLQGDDSELLEAAGRVVLRDEPFTTDLLTLQDSVHALLEGAEIPAGTYGQLRFVISGAFIEVEGEGGATTIFASSPTYAGLPAGAVVGGSLQMPSFASSGLKVNLPGDALTIVEDATVQLVVDFDVAQSFGQAAGGSGQWVMRPVLQGTRPVVPLP